MKMKIGKIRDVIGFSDWCRLDLSGHTRGEFMKRDVPEVLGRHIAELKALDIAPRFVEDSRRRDSEIVRCEAVIDRWRGMHSQQPVSALVQ